MDVGPTRSMGFTPTTIERTTPVDASSSRDDARPAADGAALEVTDDAVQISERTLVQRLDGLHRNEAARNPDSSRGETQRDTPPSTKAERNMQRLMEKVAGPLRSYLKDGPLSDDDKKALVEALTQFEADVGRLSETIDVEQLNEEMRATFERFYLSLKRIFGADREQDAASAGEAPMKSVGGSDKPEETSVEDTDAVMPRESGSDPSSERLDQPGVDEVDASGDDPMSEAYRRIASMYTTLYGDSDGSPAPLLNERG